MDTVPKRSALASPYRQLLTIGEKYLIIPVANPDFYTIVSLLATFPFLVTRERSILIVFGILSLIFDWLDGAAARRYGKTSKTGYIKDVVVDRLSEGIMLAPLLQSNLGKVFFALYLLNNVLTFYAIQSGKHYILALRFFYVVLLCVGVSI